MKALPIEDLVGKMIDFEQGAMSGPEKVRFLAELQRHGIAVGAVQGFYGRAVMRLIEDEVIDWNGEILVDLDEE